MKKTLLTLFLIFNATVTYADIRTGLEGWWRLNEGSGTTAYDASGYGNNGTFSAIHPAWVTGRLNGTNALSFDGTDNEYVVMANNVNYATVNSAFTFSAWFNLTNFSLSTTGVAVIMAMASDGNCAYYVLLSNLGSFDGISLGSACGGWTTIKTGSLPSSGAWHHVAVTYNGSGAGSIGNFQIYLDGVSQALSAAGGYGDSTNIDQIGNDTTNFNTQWYGQIEDVRIYNRALSSTDVTQLYNTGIMSLNNANLNHMGITE
jgi:hypothetical protein